MQQQQAQQLDQRLSVLHRLIETAKEETRLDYRRRVDLSWVHHDSALEGIVYVPTELAAAMTGQAPTDPALVPIYDEIRQNKAAIDLVRDMATRKKLKIDLDTLKDLYECLAPDEVEGKKPPAYRRDMPLHRLYFHEIATPDKISYKLRQFMQWVNALETRRTTHVARLAAKAHFQLLHIYPFPKHSGKLARLVMNLILLTGEYPPAVIHSTERQRYYDSLKTSDNALASIVRDALVSSIESGIRFFELSAPPPEPPPAPKKIVARTPRAPSAPLKPSPNSPMPRPLGTMPLGVKPLPARPPAVKVVGPKASAMRPLIVKPSMGKSTGAPRAFPTKVPAERTPFLAPGQMPSRPAMQLPVKPAAVPVAVAPPKVVAPTKAVPTKTPAAKAAPAKVAKATKAAKPAKASAAKAKRPATKATAKPKKRR